jgi:enediyne biosynthesis protein E4
VRAVDPRLHRDAYGAIVTLRGGERRWTGLVHAGGSYLCSNDARVHFGLGAQETVDELQVQWPDGMEERFPGRSADQIVVLRKGEGRRIDPSKGKTRAEPSESKP